MDIRPTMSIKGGRVYGLGSEYTVVFLFAFLGIQWHEYRAVLSFVHTPVAS